MDDLKFAEAWASGETLPDENLDDRWLSVCRSLIAAHERIKELEAKQQWQPIESAPRDRESLDLWVCDDAGGYRITNCHWLAERGWVYFDDGAFLEVAPDADQVISHWMPLPEPPK